MTVITYDAGAAANPNLERVISNGLESTQTAHAHVIVTRDMDHSVGQLRPGSAWSAYRGSGATYAKTLDEPRATIVLNLSMIETEDDPLELVERLVAHESCHIQLNKREESCRYHHDLARSQAAYDLVSMIDGMLEEYRCEVTVVRELGYPVMLRHKVADLAPVLKDINVEFVWAITDRGSADVSILRDRIIGVAGQLLKHLAVTSAGAAHLDGDLHQVARSTCPQDWSDYVAPTWRAMLGLLRSAPPAETPWPRDEYRSTLRSGVQFADRFLRNIGYAYTGAESVTDAFSFVRVAPDERCRDRAARAERPD